MEIRRISTISIFNSLHRNIYCLNHNVYIDLLYYTIHNVIEVIQGKFEAYAFVVIFFWRKLEKFLVESFCPKTRALGELTSCLSTHEAIFYK